VVKFYESIHNLSTVVSTCFPQIIRQELNEGVGGYDGAAVDDCISAAALLYPRLVGDFILPLGR